MSGSEVSPLLTWDSKITTVLAMLGGLQDIVKQRMIKDNVYDKFIKVVDQEWTRVFGDKVMT